MINKLGEKNWIPTMSEGTQGPSSVAGWIFFMENSC